MVALPLTDRFVVPDWVKVVVPAAASMIKEVAELLLFIVVTAPSANSSPGKLVGLVPPIVPVNPENFTVLDVFENVPPLFVQFPATIIFEDKPTKLPLANII